ncbi:phosphodiesterase [Vairimorpha necatrix]|uniref:Phosphodiesterase n=1 Tax=Vairimorpha necatrix TaxID=6039 RepID=A0AAX4JAK7_9MICR
MTRSKTKEEKKQLKVLFLSYNSILDNHKITQLSYDILSKECDFDQNDLHNFLEAAISSYNDIPYHNATHGFNALYNGNILLELIDRPKIGRKVRFIFLICCLLHDIGHPGSDLPGHNKFDLENLHVEFIKKLLSEFLPGYLTDENINLISELILSTNLISHNDVLNSFRNKYLGRNINSASELNIIDYKMLIKIADIGASYKKFDDFMCGSRKLEKELRGSSIESANKKVEEDEFFLLNYSIPLAEVFCEVFIDFKFLYENAIDNLRKLKNLK